MLIYNHQNRGTLLDVVQGTESTTHSPKMMNDYNHAHIPISCDVPVHMKGNYTISHIQVKTYTFLLKCLNAKDETVTHLVPCPESSPTPSYMHMPSVKAVIYVPSMTIFQNKSYLFYKSKSTGQTPIFTCFYQVLCVFVGSEFPGSHCRLCTPSDTFANFHCCIHMSNQEYRVFHPRGYLSLLVIPNTRIFHFLFRLCNRETHFGRYPILPSTPSNTKHSVNLPCTHDIPSNTKHSVDLPTLHSHPFNAMSPCICNARCHCMLYHVTCTMNATWTTQSTPLTGVMDNHITWI